MLNLNPSILNLVVVQAQASAAAYPRWVAAITRAAVELESNPYIEAQDDHTLLIGSPSGNAYVGNGTCQCTAYTGILDGKQVHAGNQPCWHRAAARLYHRYVEEETKQSAPPADWPRDLGTGKPMDWYAAKRAVETGAIAPLGDRLARARREMAELFA